MFHSSDVVTKGVLEILVSLNYVDNSYDTLVAIIMYEKNWTVEDLDENKLNVLAEVLNQYNTQDQYIGVLHNELLDLLTERGF